MSVDIAVYTTTLLAWGFVCNFLQDWLIVLWCVRCAWQRVYNKWWPWSVLWPIHSAMDRSLTVWFAGRSATNQIGLFPGIRVSENWTLKALQLVHYTRILSPNYNMVSRSQKDCVLYWNCFTATFHCNSTVKLSRVINIYSLIHQ